jgi:hypothetical protein
MLQYRKNKNADQLLHLENVLDASKLQNYIPLYTLFFELNETNWNSINLDHPILKDISSKEDVLYCNDEPVFFKFSPLVDPLKYLVGAYDSYDYSLPTLTTTPNPKFSDTNNSSYVDGFFTYLSGKTLDRGFLHGIHFFGSYLGIKHNFHYNMEDDLEHVEDSEYFHKQRGKLFDLNREFSFSNSTKYKQPLVVSDEVIELTLDSLEDDKDTESYSMSDNGMNLTAIIHKFPVHFIAMEKYEDTLDSLLCDISPDELNSALMQIIMTLILYQKVFKFTHNDLHTNNVMWTPTEHEYLNYCFHGKYYKVPTFGKIYKIIDFGRSIYTFQNKLFVSDSFHPDGDAATQYNTEPYFNKEEPRVDPNYSFDLCRLACSIIEGVEDKDGIYSVVNEWCLDDEGLSVMETPEGFERYPDFELYRMIALSVHKHTPQVQLERPEFKQYESTVEKNVMDIDLYEPF